MQHTDVCVYVCVCMCVCVCVCMCVCMFGLYVLLAHWAKVEFQIISAAHIM